MFIVIIMVRLNVRIRFRVSVKSKFIIIVNDLVLEWWVKSVESFEFS